MHPEGRCECSGEGKCDWCIKTEKKERSNWFTEGIKKEEQRSEHADKKVEILDDLQKVDLISN